MLTLVTGAETHGEEGECRHGIEPLVRDLHAGVM